MRPLPALSTGVIVCLLALVGCTGDQTAATAPTTMPLSNARSISTDHQYEFSLKCSQAAGLTSNVTVSAGGEFLLFCGGTQTRGPGTGSAPFTSFTYVISLGDANDNPVLGCSSGGAILAVGRYTCRAKKVSATLTVTDLGEFAP